MKDGDYWLDAAKATANVATDWDLSKLKQAIVAKVSTLGVHAKPVQYSLESAGVSISNYIKAPMLCNEGRSELMPASPLLGLTPEALVGL